MRGVLIHFVIISGFSVDDGGIHSVGILNGCKLFIKKVYAVGAI